MKLGGDGVISVLSNLHPKWMSAFIKEMRDEEWEFVENINKQSKDLMNAMFIETNPIPIKTAMTLQGLLPGAYFRSPMVPMEDANIIKLNKIIFDFEGR